ncbi:hypothetical protein QTV44_002610 [Vibrio vulnificus]|nr:hypothetical protein [Vibrio vulnificus]
MIFDKPLIGSVIEVEMRDIIASSNASLNPDRVVSFDDFEKQLNQLSSRAVDLSLLQSLRSQQEFHHQSDVAVNLPVTGFDESITDELQVDAISMNYGGV